MPDKAFIARCEAETERLHDKIKALGGWPPGPIGWSADPHQDARNHLDFALSEFRRESIERRGDALRAGLEEILPAQVLQKYDAAGVADSRTVDASVRVGFLRLLHDLLAEPKVGAPHVPPRSTAKPARREDDDDAEAEDEDEIFCPVHLDDLLGERQERLWFDMPISDLELVHEALAHWIRGLHKDGIKDKERREADVLLLRIGEELEPRLHREIERLAKAAKKRGVTILIDVPDQSVSALISTRNAYRLDDD